MKLSLIGMSGSGKSYWSTKLEEKGFLRFSCDEFIEKQLNTLLQEEKFSGIQDVAKWMGQPYEPQYPNASKKYLTLEKEAMNYLFEKLTENDTDCVLDTTGSVIYMEPLLLKTLKKLTHIVYLETPASVQDDMYQLYLQDPKPVIWGDSFILKNGETPHEGLQRCYPLLLAYRTKQYEKLADTRIDYHMVRKKNFTVDRFLSFINQ